MGFTADDSQHYRILFLGEPKLRFLEDYVLATSNMAQDWFENLTSMKQGRMKRSMTEAFALKLCHGCKPKSLI